MAEATIQNSINHIFQRTMTLQMKDALRSLLGVAENDTGMAGRLILILYNAQ